MSDRWPNVKIDRNDIGGPLSTNAGKPSLNEIQTRGELAEQLSLLRQASGFTVRTLAARLNIPVATLGGYLTGRHLPAASQLMTFTALLRECGITDAAVQQQWIDALARARANSDGRSPRGESPFRGLAAYRSDDGDRFFGRTALVQQLLDRVREVGDGDGSRIVPLVGASGSGKTSVLNAGLVRAVRAEGRNCRVITPGGDPMPELSGLEPGDLLVVDQFEELFTLVDDPAVRSAFVTALAETSKDHSVVIGLRADFYAAAMTEPLLVPALQHNQLLVTAMTSEELRSAIVGPAEQAGLTVEAGLVDAVLADMSPAGARDRAHDPGALPLMSHALLATWQRARRRELTLADYRAAGGIAGAVQQSAEELYVGLAAEDQSLSRQLFLRLVNIGEDTVLTRRRLDRAEVERSAAPTGTTALIDLYVNRRLMTSDQKVVQISHEALLTAWPRLHDWIDTDREGLRRHRQLTEAANAWQAVGQDEELLLAGTRLAAVTDWAADDDHRSDLNATERDFVDRSTAAEQRRQDARRRQTRRLRTLLSVTAVLAVIATGLAVVAWRAGLAADRDRNDATAARDAALSRQVANESGDMSATDPTVAAELAATSYGISHTFEARSAVLDASATSFPTRVRTSSGPADSVAVAPAQRVAAIGGEDGNLRLYRIGSTMPTALATAHPTKSGPLYAVTFNRNGTLLAAGGGNKQVDIWDVTDIAHPKLHATLSGFASTVYSIAISPDDTTLAAASDDGTVRRWQLASDSPIELPVLTAPKKASVHGVAFDRTGSHLAFTTANGNLLLYNQATTATATLQALVHVDSSLQRSVAFDPVADVMATGDDAPSLRLWNVPGSGAPTLLHVQKDFDSWVGSVAFTADGSRVFAGSSDSSVHVVDVADGANLYRLPQPSAVTGVAIDDVDKRVLSTDITGVLRLWPWQDRSLHGATDSLFALGYSRSGIALAATGSGDGRVALWRGDQLESDAIRSQDDTAAFGGAAAIAPDGSLVAAARKDGHIELWDAHDPAHPRFLSVLPETLVGQDRVVEGIAFSPDSKTLASGGDDHYVRVWDVSDASAPRIVSEFAKATNYVMQVAFSRHGDQLAAASIDGHTYVWTFTGGRIGALTATVGQFSSGAYSLAFSPTADELAIGGGDSTVLVYAMHGTGRPTLVGQRMDGPTDSVYAVAFSPDGRTLAGASNDGNVYLWSPGTAQATARLHATGGLFALAYSPDGSTLAAAGSGNIVQRWSTSVRASLAAICSQAGAPLTAAEWKQYVPGSSRRVGCSP